MIESSCTQNNSINKHQIHWPTFRAEIMKAAADAKTPALLFVSQPNEERAEYVLNWLRQFNQARKSPLWSSFSQTGYPLEIYALDDNGLVVGGLVGETNQIPEWLNVSVVLVTGEQQGQGIGTHLMNLAEEEAKRHNCRYALLAISDYQAPGFYQKLGYQIYGKLQNCPQEETGS